MIDEKEKFSGRVKFFNKKSKFGFIIVDDSNLEVHVRSSGLLEEVNEGDAVTFNLQDHHKGPRAIQVRKKE